MGKSRRPPAKSRPGDVPVVKPAPAEPGGPNRLARKEEARRQREAIRRKMARRRWYRVGGVALAVLMLAGGVGAYLMTRPDPAAEAGCTAVQAAPPLEGALDRIHIGSEGAPAQQPPLSDYPSVPPASGPHAAQPLPAGVYDTSPDIGQVIHSLEHGAVVVWYSPEVPDSRLEPIRRLVDADPDHVILALYDYPDQGGQGSLPEGRDLALVAWHRLQVCDEVSADVVGSFVDRFRIPTGGPPPPNYPQDGAPEPGAPLA